MAALLSMIHTCPQLTWLPVVSKMQLLWFSEHSVLSLFDKPFDTNTTAFWFVVSFAMNLFPPSLCEPIRHVINQQENCVTSQVRGDSLVETK